MSVEQRLYGLLEVVSQQQSAIDEALSALEAERVALSSERQAIGAAVQSAVRSGVSGAGDALGDAAQRAIEASVGKQTRTTVGVLVDASSEARSAATQLRKAAAALEWRWIAGVALCLVALLLCSWAAVGWQQRQVRVLLEQRAALEAEVATLQEGVDALEKRGGRIALNLCGARLCIEASADQGRDEQGNALGLGAWTTGDRRKVPLVIPRGY